MLTADVFIFLKIYLKQEGMWRGEGGSYPLAACLSPRAQLSLRVAFRDGPAFAKFQRDYVCGLKGDEI